MKKHISEEPLNALGSQKGAVVALMERYARAVEAGEALDYAAFVADVGSIYACTDTTMQRDLAGNVLKAVLESGKFRDVSNALDLLEWHDRKPRKAEPS
jgi:hypothetical protein